MLAQRLAVRYGTHDIAAAIHQSPRTVQRFLREREPEHEGWWRFSLAEYQALVVELKRQDSLRRYGGRRRRNFSSD